MTQTLSRGLILSVKECSESHLGVVVMAFCISPQIHLRNNVLQRTPAKEYQLAFKWVSHLLVSTLSHFNSVEENSYDSDEKNGKVAFSTKDCTQIIPGSNYEDLLALESVSFNVGIRDPKSKKYDDDDDDNRQTSGCPGNSQNCKVVYSRAFTPIVHYLSPRVLYNGLETSFYVDPKQCQDYREKDDKNNNLERPFTSVQVNGNQIDFSGQVDSNTNLAYYQTNQVRGKVCDDSTNPKAPVSFKFKCGNAILFNQATYCQHDNNTCYEAKVVPSIKSINRKCGYRTGGQFITIQGSGFNGKKVDIKIDGVPCEVQQDLKTSTRLVCKTGANPSPSNLDYYVGSPGTRRSIYNGDASIKSGNPTLEILTTSVETPQNYLGSYYQNIFRGYFRPPTTGNYKFYMSCDDNCQFFLSTSQDPSLKRLVLSVNSWVPYRSYFPADGSQNTSWIPLIANNYYYYEIKHTQYSGGDHISAAVEMDSTTIVGHQQSMREIQRLRINQTNVREKIAINITNFTTSNITLTLTTNNAIPKSWTSQPFSPRSTPSQLQSVMQGFWYDNLGGATISVTLTMYDSKFNVTTNASASYCNYYVISVNQPIPITGKASFKTGYTVSLIPTTKSSKDSKDTKDNTKVTVTSLQYSSLPLNGSFVLTSLLPNLTLGTTAPIPWNSSPNTIKTYIEQTFTKLKDKLSIWDGPGNYQDGRDIFIRFVSLNLDPEQIVISSATTPPITGGDPYNPTNFISGTFIPYSSNQFHEPIPYEFLFTNESTPQVEVTIDDERAVCAGLNCGYSFCDTNVLITAWSLSGFTLSIVGTNFNISSTSVNFAQQICVIRKSASSSSLIVCNVTSSTAGSYYPIVTDDNGLLPVISGLQKIVVPLIATSVSPSSVLNSHGGHVLTIVGANFPSRLSERLEIDFFITFEDGSICQLISTSATKIVCMTQEYKGDTSDPVAMCITVNDQQNCNLRVAFVPPEIVVTSISPSVASPVLPTKITIQLQGAQYFSSLVAGNLTVQIEEIGNSSHVRNLRVVKYDSIAQTILVKYNGIEPGVYNVIVRSAIHGKFNTQAVNFTSIGIITGYSPQSGSIYGGTVITINGYNFSNDFITDNAVQVGYTPCNVLSTSNTQITCITQRRKKASDPLVNDLIVFLRTFYEADCLFGVGNCTFTWLEDANLPNLTSYNVDFDTTINDYVLSLYGNGFPSDPSQVRFFIDGAAQTVTSSSDSLITITISGLLNSFSNNIQFYLPSGIPAGASQLNSGITLAPRLISTTPSIGSPAGTTITAYIKGVGVNTANVFIATNWTAGSICASVQIPSYGVVRCTTRVATIPQSTLRVSAVSSTNFYNCANEAQCSYITSTSLPLVTSQVKNQTSITFTGTNFFTSGYTAYASLKGMRADKVTIVSATQVTATWFLGIPVLAVPTTPLLWFDGGLNQGVHWAQGCQPVSNPLTIINVDQPVTCSFQGGCQISISQTGVASAVSLGNSYVSICGTRAVLSSSSSSSQAIFTVPALKTSYVKEHHEESKICGKTFSSETSSAITNGPWDDDTVNGFVSYRSPCYFGTSFKQDYIGEVSQVKYYINSFTQSQVVGKLRFQGSKDGLAYDDIFTADSKVHEGWNYYDLDEDDSLKYRFYRFYSNGTGGTCNIGEVVLKGHELIDDDGAQYQCNAQVFIDGAATPVTLGNAVTYDDDYTPRLDSIYPRFGPVQGGTEVRFFGNGFVSDTSLYTITIDGINCPVSDADQQSVTCITGKRPGLFNSTLTIFIRGKGLVITKGLVFRYMNYWSNPETWGDDFIPMEGESIVIPKGLNLLVDIKNTPHLNAIDVEGSLVFPPSCEEMYFEDENDHDDEDDDHDDDDCDDDDEHDDEHDDDEHGDDEHGDGHDEHGDGHGDDDDHKGRRYDRGEDDDDRKNNIIRRRRDNTERTFDANIIVVKGGLLEIGTEEFPYTCKLTITMHGSKYSPVLPIFGNKAIGAYGGTVDIHGIPRYPPWTELLTTAFPSDINITLNTVVDWQIGEQIVIAPSGYKNTETEVRTIVFVDRSDINKPILTLDKPLLYIHFAGIDTYENNDFIEMRSEVGLLTRNILFRGDPQTSPTEQYGANIMLWSDGDESLIGRIEYVELQYVGQAYQKGKYPIVFHMNGDASQSYVRGTSIHDSYNRAIALHGLSKITLDWNVVFMVMGHAIFLQNAAESKNVITNNLVLRVHASWSLLDTDQTPACFWITHPENIFRGNHAVGSDGKGFWFNARKNSRGHQTSINICPENCQLGEFTNNVAHSNLQHGLQIFPKLIPRRDQCQALVYDDQNEDDHYWKNPIQTIYFLNFTSWKNIINGALFERIGDVRLVNFKVADNLVAGIEVSQTRDTPDGTAQIKNALVIGSSVNAEDITTTASSRGIITPRTENFQVNGANFYGFALRTQAAFGTCSYCFYSVSTDSGARTVTTSQLYFNNATVTRRIIYQFPQRDIFYDKDGSLTGLGGETFASYYYPHNDQPECDRQELILNGLRCNSSVQIRRIAFYGNVPWIIFTSQPINILKYDNSIIGQFNSTELQNYILNTSYYSRIPFRGVSDLSGWAVPYVTGHKYKISFGSGPLDWTYIVVDQSIRWNKTDQPVYIVMNFTDVRNEVNVTAGGYRIPNQSLTNKTDSSDWESGDNDILNDTETREIRFVLNGKNKSKSNIVMTGARCAGGPCIAPLPPTVPLENFTRRWSEPLGWSVGGVLGVVPKENDTVIIPQGWNMIFDVDSPILTYLEINGILTFENNGTADLTLRSQYIFVRAGQLIIGNSTHPFLRKATILLYGEYSAREIVFVNAIEGGNKILANTGTVKFFGQKRSQFTRLTQTAFKGNNSIQVETGLDWTAGDKIAIAPNNLQTEASDYAIVLSYDTATGIATLDRKLSHYHWGQATSTVSPYNIDMRAEVVLLTRNILIQGNLTTNSWGCSVLTSDFQDGNYSRSGSTIFDNVEIFNCSQYDTLKAALRFDGAILGYSSITNSSIYQGWGMGITITSSSNILIQNTNIFSFVRFGILIETQSQRITLDQNILFQIYDRRLPSLDQFVDITAGICACAAVANDACSYSITNNIVSAANFAGYVVYGHDCGNYNQRVFYNNIAHSVDGSGAVIFPQPGNQNHLQCMEGSFFYAYKNRYDGAVSSFATPTIKYSNMIFIDNGIGPQPLVGMEGDNLWSKMHNITIWGETAARDCPYKDFCLNNSAASCVNRTGFMLPQFVIGAKLAMPISYNDLPMHINDRPASFGGNINATKMNFRNFQSGTTWCGSTQVLFGLNELAADYQPKAVIRDSSFDNIHDDAFAYFYTPPQSWATVNDCGDWSCSGPNNTYLRFEKTQFTGIVPNLLNDYYDFQLTPNNLQGVKNFTTCRFVRKWNTYQCQNNSLSVLLFESLDADKWSRIASPISISQALIQTNTTINSFMDHGWSGPQTSQKRLQRWPSVIQVGPYAEQLVSYTGTPPKNQRFKLITDGSDGTIITIRYPVSGAYQIQFSNGTLALQNTWNDTLRGVNPIKRSHCGEFRYVGVVNIFQFYLQPNCLVSVVPANVITTSIRLEWTLEEFYEDGGSTAFCDRMAATLGIKSYDIKVVAIYQGSVIIATNIQDTKKVYPSLKALSLKLINLINNNQLNVGAPVLSANIGYTPIIIPSTSSQTTNNTSNPSSKIIVTNLNGTANADTQSSSSSESGLSSKMLIIILAALAGILLIGAGLIGYWFYRKNMLRLKQVHQDGQTIIDELDQYAKIKASESARTNTLYMTEEYASGI